MNKEELKDLIQNICNENPKAIKYSIVRKLSAAAESYATSQTEALKKEIEELKKKTEWISVEDKLPNEFTSVLVVGGDIRSCALYRDKKFYTDFPLPTNEEITHWMPLPTPPKQ